MNHLTINLHAPALTSVQFGGDPPSMARAFLSSLLASPEAETEAAACAAAVDTARPAIGEVWPGQGGIYAGDFRGGDGTVYGLIVAKVEDIETAQWEGDGEHAPSDWDGLTNTAALGITCQAASMAAGFTKEGRSDFYLPARRELQLAAANIPHLFGKEIRYWSSTSHGDHYAWAVDFENGYANCYHRDEKFRVRPVRRFIY